MFSYGGQGCKLRYVIREYHLYAAFFCGRNLLAVYVGYGIY